MTLALIGIAILVFVALAINGAPFWSWAVAALIFGVLSLTELSTTSIAFSSNIWLWIVALLPAAILGLLTVPAGRLALFTRPAYGVVKSILPRVSRTEQEALDAGTVGWDAELFSGRPDWRRLFAVRRPTLSAEEQAFLAGPVEELCGKIDDWEIRHSRADMPADVWKFLKDKGFLGMLISREHGGLGFSAQAQSMVVGKVASRSIAAGITVMVPNSLGPGELLEKYGTPAQQKKYLRRLAKGQEVPCFALTGPHSGSDAAGMRDVGIVAWGEYEGKKVLGVRLSWDKRYITLAPVATLVGLAFRLKDPENVLKRGDDLGITIALIPADHPGVEIGRRHFPSRSAFMNGPIRGRDVFIPMDFLIGGPERAGQGWRMLMECLSTGRAISLPAIGTASIKYVLRVTSAYARIRRQFGIAIGTMEGVAEPIAEMVKSAYTYEAARALTASMVDDGEKPSVISALLKYRTTEAMRDRVNEAMDIHGGRAVQDGPSNYLFSAYAMTPVAITVEGANILTRTLITFAQGALRAHPFLFREIEALQNPDKAAGLIAFDAAFGGHISFMLRNIAGCLVHSLTLGEFNSSPVEDPVGHWYRQLALYSRRFALLADVTVVLLGGDLKRKQLISGRMADILSELYLLSATLRRFEDEGRIAADRPLVDAIAADCLARAQDGFSAVLHNFPNHLLRGALRFVLFPFGRHARPARDAANYRFARAVLRPGLLRDRLTQGIYVSADAESPTGALEDTMIKVTAAEAAESKFVRAIKKGIVERRLDRDAIADALDKGVLTAEEATLMRAADEATDRVVQVDDFATEDLARAVAAPAPARARRTRAAPAEHKAAE